MPYNLLTPPHRTVDECLHDIPGSKAHPVLIAKHMLLLASLLQHLDHDMQSEMKDLSQTPRDMSMRLADLAHDAVTSKDDLIGSIESLECCIFESIYRANLGDLQRSWLTNRRAVNIAQLLGINRQDDRAQYTTLDPTREPDAKKMWSRIVFFDRILCLLLGYPQACNSPDMSTQAILAMDVPMERLERIHCMVAARVLERNESQTSVYDIDFIRALDSELQQAARELPSKWWLAPTLSPASNNSVLLTQETGRLFVQILHYNLLNQLHLPHMLCSSSPDEYSRATCVTASREVLVRFLALRSFNSISSSCRIVECLALMAAVTLLLAHLDGRSSESLLTHQYHSDRALIERLQETISDWNYVSDSLTGESLQLLQRMLDIDVDTAASSPRSTKQISVERAGLGTKLSLRDEGGLTSYLPYFGIIRILGNEMGVDPEIQSSSSYGYPSHHIDDDIVAVALETPPTASYNQRETFSQSETSVYNDWNYQVAGMDLFADLVRNGGEEWGLQSQP